MARDYVFTAWKRPKWDEDCVRYICFGEEVAPSTGRKHWQGFAIFKRTCRFKKAKLWIGAGDDTHIECRKGTRDEARQYCAKEGSFEEWGIYEGVTKDDLFHWDIDKLKAEYPAFYCRYWKGLYLLNIDKGPKWRDVSVTWLWGVAGCGKTRYVMEMNNVYKCDDLRWWDGYEGEYILLIDDVDIDDFSARKKMLNILDGYRLRLETKGSHTYAKWGLVFITSNWDPSDLLLDKAFGRRVTTVTCLG